MRVFLAFSPFSTMFSEAFFLRVVKNLDFIVKDRLMDSDNLDQCTSQTRKPRDKL